ncbi:MAG TPA: 3-phosphoshikimate 1-carboxyvinyltransferase [Acidimicrobiia bacterium]|nr:3-phosphoshikimate 1-carboxyvinyltransferase [Acidimicrobiia bacterium]
MSSRSIGVKKGPIEASVRPPGSKSLTIRSLFAASLAEGTSRLGNPLDSGDTRAARGAVHALGVTIEEADGRWGVEGSGGALVPTSVAIDAGESGLTARCLIALGALVPGPTEIVGRGRLPQRPMAGLLEALATLGVRARANRGGLPIVVEGSGSLRGGTVRVSTTETTQFATAMLLVAPLAAEPLTIVLDDPQGSTGYLDLTLEVMSCFGARVERSAQQFLIEPTGYRAIDFAVEPDASAAVYPLVATAIRGGRLTVSGLGAPSRQPDLQITRVLAEMGCVVTLGPNSTDIESGGGRLQAIDADLSAMPDGAVAVAVACLFADGKSRLTGLASLRHKESDRLRALADQLRNVGGEARVEGDSLVIVPGVLHPATIDTYGDHRIAMSFSLVGLVQPGIEIEEPAVVDKTWPAFWQMLEAL